MVRYHKYNTVNGSKDVLPNAVAKVLLQHITFSQVFFMFLDKSLASTHNKNVYSSPQKINKKALLTQTKTRNSNAPS